MKWYNLIKSRIKGIIKEIRSIFSIYFVGRCFSHKGFVTKGAPKNKSKDLAKIIEIKITVSFTKRLDDPDLKCVAPLLGDEIMWSEKE